MITLRKAEEREHLRQPTGEAWLTFSNQARSSPDHNGFSHLRSFEENRLPPLKLRQRPVRELMEIITYVREGTIAYEDSTGRSGLVSAGEFQRMTAGPGLRYGETNTSATQWAHVFQMWLRPCVRGINPGHEQKRFSAAQRRNIMCVVASPDGNHGSLRTHLDAILFSSLLDKGQHVVHEISLGRSAWLHIVHGSAQCGSLELRTGDAVGYSGERSVSLTAAQPTEILLLDLGEFTSGGPLEVTGSI